MTPSIRKFLLLATLLFTIQYQSRGQISPPGLSDMHIASWLAVGVDQKIGQSSKRRSFTYIGFGRMSDPDSRNLLAKPSIFILNEAYKQELTDHLSYTAALSYRRQNRYKDKTPYEAKTPSLSQEFRLYGKFSYRNQWANNQWNIDFRPEFRKFFTPSFARWNPTTAVRLRLKAKAAIPLTEDKVQQLIVSAEALFQNDHNQFDDGHTKDWTGFQYADMRFCLYYRLAPEKWPVYAELGYMNQLDDWDPAISRHHIGLDIVFKDLFCKK